MIPCASRSLARPVECILNTTRSGEKEIIFSREGFAKVPTSGRSLVLSSGHIPVVCECATAAILSSAFRRYNISTTAGSSTTIFLYTAVSFTASSFASGSFPQEINPSAPKTIIRNIIILFLYISSSFFCLKALCHSVDRKGTVIIYAVIHKDNHRYLLFHI